ncbi:MAG: hypothetical protein EOO07_09900 [Chitinophagaceae bacterium]|nr:MAG: hypothetical protein EOO07_09900 [Chitinophagaceae bacterium]
MSLQHTFGQNSIEDKIKSYALAKPSGNLFVHFDKNVYSNNETVYFTGYIIKNGKIPMAAHKVMAVALIREVDSALITDDKFTMDNGLSFGSLTIPDSIPTGNYRFLVYTNKLVNKLPELLFVQHITIKSSIDPAFKASVKLVEETNANSKQLKVLLSTTTADGRFLPKPAEINYSYGSVRKRTLTDALGQSILLLPAQNNLNDPNLYLKLKSGKDSTFINLAMPQPKGKASVKFYPEGGNMVSGLATHVAWEVKDLQNRPMALSAFLYKNQKIVDTIETSSYGIGSFWLTPEAGENYSVKLIHSNVIDTLYRLPGVLNKGISLHLPRAFVNDTLRINLKSTAKTKITLLVHNFKETFFSIPYEIKNENLTLKLPLIDLPKGLITLTILDSLDQPLAERIFFAHYNDIQKVGLSTDQETYGQREKVILKLNLNANKNAVVSIAAVQQNRIEVKKMNDIESYTYLTNELLALPIHAKGNPFKDKLYLEQILLTKGWRRYSWQELSSEKPVDTVLAIDSLTIGGRVSKAKKEITQPIIIGTMGGLSFNLINTTDKGVFNLDLSHLITPSQKKMYVFVNGSQKIPYETKIQIKDDFSRLNETIGKTIAIEQPILPSSLMNNSELVLKNNEKAIRLKEVVITNRTDLSFRYSGANACGDYVCLYNILNCRNHPGDARNTQPVKGKSYLSNGIKETYLGCTIADQGIFTLVKGIHQHKEFYQDDYKDPNEPAFFSTIYWNYATLLTDNKQTEISFYTSDITGKFKVIVQGITDNDVIYAEHFFEVRGK